MTSSTDSSEYESSSGETEVSDSSSPAKRSKPRKQVKKAKKGKSHKAKKAKSSKRAKTSKAKKSRQKKEKKSRKESDATPGGTDTWNKATSGWSGGYSWSAGDSGGRSWKSDAAASSAGWGPKWNKWEKPRHHWQPKAAAKAQILSPNFGGGDTSKKQRWEHDAAPDAWADYWQIARQNNEEDEWRVPCPAAARDEGIIPVLTSPNEHEIARIADGVLLSFQVPRSMLEAVIRAMLQAEVVCPTVDGIPAIFQIRGEGWGHLVIPLVEQGTDAPLQSPMHRELLESETHHYSFAHGTSQHALPLILRERIIRPQNFKKGSTPTVGPFGVASPGHLTMNPDCSTLRTILKRSRSISKGQQPSTILCEVRTPETHVKLDAGTGEQLQISSRDAGLAVGPDSAVARSDLTYILGVAITYPFQGPGRELT
ncbi:unnamed protein product [Symbiodinium sp. CCMP2592]|nr:unnamed protein product [Symbiodinium sp. CCMP2592]